MKSLLHGTKILLAQGCAAWVHCALGNEAGALEKFALTRFHCVKHERNEPSDCNGLTGSK